jgi:hypothetical protein
MVHERIAFVNPKVRKINRELTPLPASLPEEPGKGMRGQCQPGKRMIITFQSDGFCISDFMNQPDGRHGFHQGETVTI